MPVRQPDLLSTPPAETLADNRLDKCIRVLHLNAGNMYGGVETMLTTLARLRHLCPGMEPHFGLCYPGRLSDELCAAGVRVHMLGQVRISRPWTVWRARNVLRKLLRRERIDLVICHMAWSQVVFAGTARATGHKVALWTHGFQLRRNWLERMAQRLVPDIAIANSRFTAAIVQKQFPNLPVQVIYCPVALPDSAQADSWRAALRKEQSVEDDTTVILQVSRLEYWKGHELLLRGLSRLTGTGKWVCWIVGGPQKPDEDVYLRQLKALANELGLANRIRFLGHRADVPKLMAAADIFCQPNLQPEPFGIVFVEALWAGRPVITTAMGGAVEIVDESCGSLTKPGDCDSLAESLRRLIESPELRTRLGRAGSARARQLCDPASQMMKLKEVSQVSISGGGWQ